MVESRRAPLSPCGTSSYEFAPWHTSDQSRELIVWYNTCTFLDTLYSWSFLFEVLFWTLGTGAHNKGQANVERALSC